MEHKPVRLVRAPLRERFFAKVGTPTKDGCWPWLGTLHPTLGYGRLGFDNKVDFAHRVSYGLLVGPIPDGLQIDHLCRNRGCVNPDHLEAVTQAENIRRGIWSANASIKARERSHCRRGHLYLPDNLYLNKNGTRSCMTCRREAARRHYWKKKSAT